MSERSKYWDNTVKPLAQKVIEKSTVDEAMIKHFVGGMIWGIEHDLADGGFGLKAIQGISVVRGTFSSDSYYGKVHLHTPEEETNRMKKLAKELDILIKKSEDD